MSKQPKPWKRSLELISRCRSSGKTLCCFNRQTEEEGTEVIYFLEPGGDPVKKEASRLDPFCDFDAFGTCSKPLSPDNKMGWLNNYVGAKPREVRS